MVAESAVVPVQPRGDMVLVEMDEAETQTASGLFLPGTLRAVRRGTVRAVGPGALSLTTPGARLPMDLKSGDRVYLADDRYRAEFDGSSSRWALVPQGMIAATLNEVLP